MDEIEQVLKEREEQYGAIWLVSSELLAHLVRIAHHMPLFQSKVLTLWLGCWKKLMRLIANPNHRDSWIDLAGYATKAADYLGGRDDARNH